MCVCVCECSFYWVAEGMRLENKLARLERVQRGGLHFGTSMTHAS